jgi:transcriptional regulator with XRE-family HTH domain
MPLVRDAATIVKIARARAGLSLRELARRADTSHPALVAYEGGRTQPSVATLARVVEAAGFGLDLELCPRPERLHRIDRGEELEAVLALAEAFPARHRRRLDAPVFGRS